MAIQGDRSVKAHLSLLDVPLALRRDVDEVDAPVAGDYGHAAVLGIETDRLHVTVELDLGEAEIAVPVLVQNLHPRESGLLVFDLGGLGQVLVVEAVLAHLDTLLDGLANLEDVDAFVGAGARDDVLRGVEDDAGDLSLAVSALELLDELAAITAEDLDDVAADGG